MKSFLVYIFLVTVFASSFPLHAQEGEIDVDSIMAEIGELADEQEANNEKIKIDLNVSQEADRDVATNDQELATARAESKQASSEAAAMVSQHGGNYSGGTYTINCGDDSNCSSQISGLKTRFDRYNSLRNTQKSRRSSKTEASKNVSALRQRNSEISRRIATLRGILAGAKASNAAKKRNICVTNCNNNPGADAAAQCLQNCWDGARSQASLPNVKQVQKPSFSMKPRRTAEQAIAEYKKSGAARPGPYTLRTRKIPPPKLTTK